MNAGERRVINALEEINPHPIPGTKSVRSTKDRRGMRGARKKEYADTVGGGDMKFKGVDWEIDKYSLGG